MSVWKGISSISTRCSNSLFFSCGEKKSLEIPLGFNNKWSHNKFGIWLLLCSSVVRTLLCDVYNLGSFPGILSVPQISFFAPDLPKWSMKLCLAYWGSCFSPVSYAGDGQYKTQRYQQLSPSLDPSPNKRKQFLKIGESVSCLHIYCFENWTTSAQYMGSQKTRKKSLAKDSVQMSLWLPPVACPDVC